MKSWIKSNPKAALAIAAALVAAAAVYGIDLCSAVKALGLAVSSCS